MIIIVFHVESHRILREALDWSMNVTNVRDVSKAKTIYERITTGRIPIEYYSWFLGHAVLESVNQHVVLKITDSSLIVADFC